MVSGLDHLAIHILGPGEITMPDGKTYPSRGISVTIEKDRKS